MQRALVSVCVALVLLLQTHHGRSLLGEPRTVDIIRSYGYDAEEYSVTTEDGYILVLTHIKSKSTKLPVLMMHGVVAASDQWVLRGPGQDLAFILADEGHDVWLADQRGNCFSRKHVYLKPSEPEFWNFSFHESGVFDLAAFIDTVLEKSGSKQLYYVGHSMGTTDYFVLCSLRPQYNDLVKMAIQLSPVAFGIRKPYTTAIGLLLQNVNNIVKALESQKTYEFLPRTATNMKMIDDTCTDQNKNLCLFLVSQAYGPETVNTNPRKLAVYLKKLQSGTSLRTVQHLVQIFKTLNFTWFDYGRRQNTIVYGSEKPPEYPVWKVTSPVALFYSDKDSVVDDYSVNRLARLLPNVVTTTMLPKYNHIDLLFADSTPTVLYKRIVKLLNKA